MGYGGGDKKRSRNTDMGEDAEKLALPSHNHTSSLQRRWKGTWPRQSISSCSHPPQALLSPAGKQPQRDWPSSKRREGSVAPTAPAALTHRDRHTRVPSDGLPSKCPELTEQKVEFSIAHCHTEIFFFLVFILSIAHVVKNSSHTSGIVSVS